MVETTQRVRPPNVQNNMIQEISYTGHTLPPCDLRAIFTARHESTTFRWRSVFHPKKETEHQLPIKKVQVTILQPKLLHRAASAPIRSICVCNEVDSTRWHRHCILRVRPRIQSLARVLSSCFKPPLELQSQPPALVCADYIPQPIGHLLHSNVEFIVLFRLPRSAMQGDYYMLMV